MEAQSTEYWGYKTMLDPSSLKKSKAIGAHEPIVSQATGMTMWLRERLIVIQFLFQLTVGNLVFYEFLPAAQRLSLTLVFLLLRRLAIVTMFSIVAAYFWP